MNTAPSVLDLPGQRVPRCKPPTSQSKRSSLGNFSISGQGRRRRRPAARAPGADCKGPPESVRRRLARERASSGIRVQPGSRIRQQTPHAFPARGRGDDDYRVRRTHAQPALARQYAQGSARETRSVTGATRVPPPRLPPPPQLRARLGARPPPERSCRLPPGRFKWWGLRAAPAAAVLVAPRAAVEGRVKMAAALAL